MPKEELGMLVRAALVKAGCTKPNGELSTYRAEKMSGIDNSTIRRIVAGERSPTIETLEAIFQPIGWEVAVSFFPGKNGPRK